MQENQQPETSTTKNREYSQSPEIIPIISPNIYTDQAHQFQIWLDLPIAREQRRFLEAHCHLLDEQSETILHDLFAQEPEGSVRAQKQREALLLLQDARRRGGTAEAVREAYINLYGGFVLDLPSRLEVTEQRLTKMLKENRPEETAEARMTLLQHAFEHVKGDIIPVPELLATLQYELADAWYRHPRIDRKQALEIVINFCKEALLIFTVKRYSYQYAKAQTTLGNAYRERIVGKQYENLEQAITCYQEALSIYTLDIFPFEYARAQNSLGLTYWKRIAGERRENLEQAIVCYQAALRVHTLDAFPSYYATTQNNLGLAYWERLAGERRENLEQAIVCYQEALRVRTFDAFPFYYATTQSNLGGVYTDRIAGKRCENLEHAITCCHEALKVWTLDAFPFYYAIVQNTLGSIYTDRIAGKRYENLEHAITCCREALQIHTLESFPFYYAMAQSNLGLMYELRKLGEQGQSLELAIGCQHEALRVWNFGDFPFYYAGVQNYLGRVYVRRILGEPRDNLEHAITCYQNALHVYTMEAFPHENRDVQLNIAEAEIQRENWNAAQNAYHAAIEAEDLLALLGVGTAGRDAILKSGRDAAIRFGYVLNRLGCVKEAAVAMERGRAQGLAEAMAFDAADPALIIDEARRTRYTNARATLIRVQADLHTPLSQELDENTRRRFDLERTAAYRQAKATFDALVMEIRVASDPADFLNDSLNAATILQAAQRIGSGHALVYLVATPWGGVAIAALIEQRSSSARFASLDLPDLTDTFVTTLIETHLQGDSDQVIGGFALAQIGKGFERVCQQWEGETFQAKAQALHAVCQNSPQDSTLDRAASATMACSPCDFLAKQPLTHLDQNDHMLLEATFDAFFLQQELRRCLPQLETTIIHPLTAWLQEQDVTSLTLIPCGHLAAFPLSAVLLPDGRSLGETLPTGVAPSARSLLQTATTRSPQAGMVTLGDPQNNLPWSEAEALTLTALARRATLPAEVYLKQQATRENLLAALSNRWVVNACCHGTFDAQDFLQSALRLAYGERITMAEMLNHHADLRGLRLLLLSACQTALLDLQGARDEGHSLAAAMVQAGAQAVLATQWAVDDKATYLLMVRFIQEWLPQMESEPPATALARAQAWLRRVTNAELAVWRRTMPIPEMLSTTRSAEQNTTSSWQRIPVRGRSARWQEDEAQLIVRIDAEREEPSAQPYTDPYYWAGFQVIGW